MEAALAAHSQQRVYHLRTFADEPLLHSFLLCGGYNEVMAPSKWAQPTDKVNSQDIEDAAPRK
jgi:hypothetical protein